MDPYLILLRNKQQSFKASACMELKSELSHSKKSTQVTQFAVLLLLFVVMDERTQLKHRKLAKFCQK